MNKRNLQKAAARWRELCPELIDRRFRLQYPSTRDHPGRYGYAWSGEVWTDNITRQTCFALPNFEDNHYADRYCPAFTPQEKVASAKAWTQVLDEMSAHATETEIMEATTMLWEAQEVLTWTTETANG